MKKNLIVLTTTALVFLMIGIIIGRNTSNAKKNILKNEQDTEVKKVSEFGIENGWIKSENFQCMKMTEAIDIDPINKLFITRNNELYSYSTDKVFSNGENYKKIETDIKFQKFIKNTLVDVNNNLYKFTDEKIEKLKVPSKKSSDDEKIDFSIAVNGPGELANFKERDFKNMSYVNYDFRKYFYFHLKDNNVFYYKVKYNESNETILDSTYALSNEKLVDLEWGEYIEFFIDGTIKTNKGYYIFENRLINKEETEKYADVKPEYKPGFYKIEDERITKINDKIAFLKAIPEAYQQLVYIVTTDGELLLINFNLN